ncbi:hypothetical protein ACOMHN_006946 [Nucella lapillus]
MRWSLKQCVVLVFVTGGYLLLAFYQHMKVTERLTRVTSSCITNQTGAFQGHAHSKPEYTVKFPFDNDASDSAPEVKLLIVTYMRSGSSFTGAIFDQNPAAMYVYEPLLVLDKVPYLQKWAQMPMFWDKKDIDRTAETEVKNLGELILTGYFNCRFKDIVLEALTSEFQRNGDKTLMFADCLGDHPGLLGVLQCLPILQKTCRQSKAVVIKTIRYSMKDAVKLMTKDPRIKVLHVVRDPRAIMQSRVPFGVFRAYEIKNYLKTFCERMLTDLEVGDAIAQTFPGRVIRLRYEDLALRPLPYAKKLLQFAGLRMSPAEEKELEKLTSTDMTKEFQKKYVLRTNSSVRVSLWRENPSSYIAGLLDSYCGGVYRLAGYVPCSSMEKLTDLSVPLMLPASKVLRLLD